MEDYLAVARRVFEGAHYETSDEDVIKLAANMALLEERKLGKLNQNLIKNVRQVWNFVAEHNFAVLLVSMHGPKIPISYEPDMGTQDRPPDFKVAIGDITYWIQMKDLAKLERENRQDKIIQQIEGDAKKIKIGKFFSCMLSDDFKKDCVPELITFMKDKATSAVEGEKFTFRAKNNQKAEIEFWSAEKITLCGLTLGCAGDLETVEITGLAKGQIKESLLNAVGAFNWATDTRNINLIVMEADHKYDIDICDALFGAECYMLTGKNHSWCRKPDGLFNDSDFSDKVAGVIAIKRKQERNEEITSLSPEEVISRLSPKEKKLSSGMTPEKIKKVLEWRDPGPIANYSLILYMNDKFKHFFENIKKLLKVDKIVYFNMRPLMGQGNFEI